MSFAEKAVQIIPADVRMYSGCRDDQTSADVSNVAAFEIPDPAGRAGGACTSAILKVLYSEKNVPTDGLTIIETLRGMRDVLDEDDYTQVPQLTSSRKIDVNEPFEIVPEGSDGTRRAVLVGINYVGSAAELSGCHNDVFNIKEYLMDAHGFEEENITILVDDGEHTDPTRENITDAYNKLVSECEAGDAVFCHYSGHGGQLRDDDYGEEDDGFDETLIPVDYIDAGQIRDDELFTTLVRPMPAGVTMTCLMDCCHSGTVLDLPYQFRADSESGEMTENAVFEPNRFLQFIDGLVGKLGRALFG